MTRPPIRQPLRSNSRICAAESTANVATAGAGATLPLSPVRLMAVSVGVVAAVVGGAAGAGPVGVVAAVALALVVAAVVVRAFAVRWTVAMLNDAILALVLRITEAAGQAQGEGGDDDGGNDAHTGSSRGMGASPMLLFWLNDARPRRPCE